MALIKCPECNKEISDKAKSCPYCGFPINNNMCVLNGKECDLSFLLDETYSFVYKVRDMVQLSGTSIGDVRPIVEKILETKEIPPTLNIFRSKEVVNVPKCPTCGSTNIKRISATERATSILGLGIFSKKINKTYKCLNCNHTW